MCFAHASSAQTSRALSLALSLPRLVRPGNQEDGQTVCLTILCCMHQGGVALLPERNSAQMPTSQSLAKAMAEAVRDILAPKGPTCKSDPPGELHCECAMGHLQIIAF